MDQVSYFFYQGLFLATLEDFELTYSRFDLGKKIEKKNTLRFEMLVVFSVRKTNICLMPLLKLMPFAASRGSRFVFTFFHQITKKKEGLSNEFSSANRLQCIASILRD